MDTNYKQRDLLAHNQALQAQVYLPRFLGEQVVGRELLDEEI